MGTAASATDPSHTIKIGDVVLDRYRVVDEIAAGGHSVVFRGLDERLARPVCIKVFSGFGGKSAVERTNYEHFVQEAFALSRLTHPNTIRIYDFGHLGSNDQEGMPIQVCEFMDGGTLSNVVRERGRQSLSETARVIGAMCGALSEAHALGIVHRDIKPQNILFGSVGAILVPKLADFGIAKWSAETDKPAENRAEDTAIVVGHKLAMYSPSWAAPEQLAGQPVSAATDIYALAIVAVYMLSGKAIFADEDVYAGYKKRRHFDEVVRDALGPVGISGPVIEILTRALSFDPKTRISSVDELARALLPSLTPAMETPATPPWPIATHPDPVGSHAAEPRAPWMAAARRAPAGTARHLPLSDLPQHVGDRVVQFIRAHNHQADLAGPQETRLRVTLIDTPTGLVIQVKGMTCFVAKLGGRPSPAVQLSHPCDLALVTPRAQDVGHCRVAAGARDGGRCVFELGSERVSVGTDDCADPILFDFGPGFHAYFVYTRGRSIPKVGGV